MLTYKELFQKLMKLPNVLLENADTSSIIVDWETMNNIFSVYEIFDIMYFGNKKDTQSTDVYADFLAHDKHAGVWYLAVKIR